ncbi:MAG: transcriptional regulator, MarR family [Pseudonocardia sp.]|jgi:DNA-binding MarR family transcriptional regulator|nr:transcriptional regulator, MarR family [Pseudonocardia sp.]
MTTGPVTPVDAPDAAAEAGERTAVADDVEATLLAARALVAISAQSVAAVDDIVTPPQLRVLVMIASRGPLNLAAVARSLGVHPSNATRLCDRLVAARLVDRRDDPADRRNLQLQLTDEGRRLVNDVMNRRRQAIAAVLERMPALQRTALVPVLVTFAEAAGELPDEHLWSLGWTTGAAAKPAAGAVQE